MRVYLSSLLALALCISPAFAQGKILLDAWDTAYLGDGKAGFVHTIAREIDRNGTKLIQTNIELRLRVKRLNGIAEVGAETGTIETRDGKVVGTTLKQFLGQQLQNQIDGVVSGKQITLTQNGKNPLKPAPWNPAVIGLYKQQYQYRELAPKPGDKGTFLNFEPIINHVVDLKWAAKEHQYVQQAGSRQKTKLLVIEQVPDRVEEQGNKIQLPPVQLWLDENYNQVKMVSEIPGLATVTYLRSTKAIATAPIAFADLVDISTGQQIQLKNRILQAHKTSAAVYRITVRGDDDVATSFSRDGRQEVKKVAGHTFELHVKGSRESKGGAEKEPGAEFLQSSYFITSADDRVKELARQAVGTKTDPLEKAQRIERWVHDNMNFTTDEQLATAQHVAKTLKGDCTEYAMLTAAMCRAEGIPSRTAIGLVYAEEKGRPFFAFHMWTEVWIGGRWNSIDATIGQGYIGAGHLKITDSSWHDERTMTPLLPVTRVVGRLSIDVLSAENR